MTETKNLIIAVVLSVAIIGLWQHFYTKPRVEVIKQQYAEQKKAKQEYGLKDDVVKIKEDKVVSRAEAIGQSSRVIINNGKLHGSISLKGARFDDLTLAEYKEENRPDSPEVTLLSPANTDTVYFAEFGWVGSNIKLPDSSTIWQENATELTKDTPVELSWNNGQGLKFILDISLDENYMFKIVRKVENASGADITISPYGLINRVKPEHKASAYISHEGVIGAMDDILNEVTYKKLKEEKKFTYKDMKGWLGITDKFWLSAIIPDKGNLYTGNFTYYNKNGNDRYQVDFLGNGLDVSSGASIEITDYFYAGAKKVGLLDKYRKNLNIDLFDRAVDLGWLYFITKPIFKMLTFFHHLVGNFGIAILLLTISIKLLLFPLANKSYVSMHHLKRLQPQMMDLRERYAHDKQSLNQAMMELYKTEKVNPMSGCLPLLLQIPIFFALYKVLYVTIEMRHAPFFGWITDLSEPDPTTIFNLFGLLPFTPPSYLMVGAWPLIMGVTMFLQQRMSPPPTDPTQAKVMKILPIAFTFIFATFPAGLVIYWAWNNTLSILQQWIITRKLK